MNRFCLVFAILIVCASSLFAAVGVDSPSTPSPLPSFLTIKNTAQASIATNTQLIVGKGTPQNILIHNESGALLRIGTDTTVLTTGFGLPAGAMVYFNLSPWVDLYVTSDGTAVTSYVKGE